MEAKYIKFKNIFIVCILLIFLVSLSTAVASDLDDTNKITNDGNLTVQTSIDDGAVIEQSNQEIMNTEQGSESDQGDVLSASSDDENELLSASSDEEILTGTSNELYTLIYYENTYLDLGDDYSLTYAVSINNKNGLVIDGNGHTIDGQGSRIFEIKANCINITFKNIVFKNSRDSAIYLAHQDNYDYSYVTFENCTFMDNYAPQYGGAIRVNFFNQRGMYGEIHLINCNFTRNSAVNGGGAVYARNAGHKYTNIYVTNSTFTNNSVTSNNDGSISGGVFHTYNTVDLHVKSSTFTGNSAVGSGGIFRSSGMLEIDDCEFYSNRAGQDGACIFMGNTVGVLTVTNSKFEDNYAGRWGGVVMGYGYRFESCTFNNNKVNTSLSASGKANTGRGGVMCSREGYSIVVADCNFTNNVAQEGGAICMEERASSISISGSTFNNNQATLKGGAVYTSVTTLATISTSTFESNSANYGGAVWSSNDDSTKPNGRVIIQSSEFKSNTANIQGGALCLNTPRSEVVDSEFRFNTAPIGGAIYWNGNEGKVQGSTFESNSGLNGSSIYWAYANGNLVSSDFKDTAPSTGMVHWHGSNGAISQSTFEGTRAVHICSHASDVALTSNTQVSNSYDGPSVYLEGTASFDSNDFMNAIYNYGVILSQTYLVTLNNNTIITNVNSLPVFTRIEDDNGNPIRVRENMTLIYDSNNQLSTTFNHTDYVSSVSNLAIGLHNFTARGYNTANFNNIALKNGAVLYLVMNLTVNQTNYGEKVVFTVTLVNTTLNGTIGLDINDVHYNLPMSNGVANLTLYNMAPNEYVVTATYMEYNQTLHTNVTIDVRLRNSTINVTANNITYGETVTININVTEGASGTVLVFVNNNKYTVTLKNSTAQLNLTGITGGTYNVFAVYNGDVNFNGNDNSTQFTVKKFNSTVLINATDVDYGQTAIIEVKLPSDANGTTIVYVDSTPYEFTKQPITVSVANLSAGTHTVRVVYDGNDKYLPNSNSTVFKVNKIKITPTITVHNIKVGDNATITVNLIGATNATGLVLLTVNDNNYYVYANKTHATLILSGLPYGKYNVTATYLEDDIHYTATTNSSFKVDYVVIDPAISYGQDDDLNVLLNVTVPADVNGDIIIEVNGTNYTAPVVKGKFSVQIKGLTGGQYPAILYFANDTKYQAVNKPFNITLSKSDIQIHINAPNSYVGDNATITVTVPSDAEGNVTITSNNKSFTEKVVNGVAVFSVPNLAHDTYDIVAVYSGDGKYNPSDVTGRLYVDKVDPNPYSYINVTNIHVGETATFNITMPNDITGKVYLTMQNETYTVNVTNGFGQINITGLKAGSPVLVNAYFAGNDKYYECNRNYTAFAVLKITNYPVNITAVTNSTVANNMTANITVKIADDANGEGYITIDNKTYDVIYTNGVANIFVDSLTAGNNYTVVAYFAGDDKYTEGRASKEIGSNKTLDYIFLVSADDIFVGQTAVVVIYLPNATLGDSVTLYVPGKGELTFLLTNETWKNGTIQRTVPDLAAGSYDCYVTYHGNTQYDSSTRFGTLVVSKYNTSPRLTYNTTYVGENLTVQISLPTDSNGTVSLNINNKTYNATVVNGTAFITVPGLEAKTYSSTLSYSGNEKYNARDQKYDIRILKVYDYLFEVSTVDIYVGDNETITIQLPKDIDGNVRLTIPGTSYINQTVTVINGNATVKIPSLKVGNYNVTVSVTNSSKYLDESKTRTFKVSTIGDYIFTLDNVTTVYVRDNITIVVHLPEDATGNVTVNIFDENHTGIVDNGTATIKVKATKDGTFTFTASFEETGKYNYKSLNGYAVVIKKEVVLNPTYSSEVNVDENITFHFNLGSDVTGNVSVTSRGVTYTEELVNGSANVTVLGYPLASVYSPSVSYTGDDKYYAASGVARITTHKVSDYNITVEVANITVDDDELVNITVPSDATEDVLVSGNFSDNTMSVKLTNGTATYKISDLPAGTYYINVRYQGYQKYADKNVTKIFRVDKVVPPISIEFTNNDTLTVKLPTLANGIANITIGNNPTVQIDIVNGVGSLNVSYLRPGNYSVNATFMGGVRYLENSTNITITIPKIEDYILPIKVDDITVFENTTIVVTVPEYATGNVNITIDGGEVIEVPIIGGTATYDASGLKVGNHTVVASYKSDEYVFKSNSTNFTVSKVNTELNYVLDYNATSLTVNVTLTETVTGNVTITIDGVPHDYYDIDSNKINLTVPTLPGTHIITIDYSGDENHTVASAFTSVVISKVKDYNLTVSATPVITVVENNIIVVTITKGIEGEVTLYINGEEYDEYAIINSTTGKATLTLDKLPSGNYTLVAAFSSNVYDRVENSTTFEVIKLNTTISVNVTNITKDLTEVINVTLNKNATGYVEIFINNVTFRVKVENGTAVLTRSNLVDKTYPIVVTYSGDDFFNVNETTAEFTVSKIPVNITITCNDIVIGQEANFTIVTSRNITDQVTVRIDNKNYTAVVYNGKGDLIVLGQNVGLHNVTVFYAGDKDYLPANDTINVTVYGKLPTSVTVNVTNITVGESVTIYINLTGDVNGTVAIAMLGNPIIVQMVNGTGNYTYYNLTARDYHFTVAYFESEFYLASNATGDFTVFKKNSPISANVTNATVGDVEVITVNLPTNATGTVLLTVNGSNYYGKVDKGVARFNVTGLPVGNHTAYITYEGDNNYLENETEINLTTARRTTTINITTANVIVDGHPVTFTIMTSANMTEVVTVKIVNRGTGLTVLDNHTFIENGKGTFTAYGLRTGNYTAYVYFPGNTHYDAVSNSTNFTVAGKAPTSLNITVRNITVSETATIYVNVTGAKTGNVTISMAGRPQTKEVVNGQVNFTYSDLAAGKYAMTVVYIENDNYLRSSATADLTVFRKNSTVSVNASDIFVGDVEVINVTLTQGVTGHILVDIGQLQVYAQINGSNIVSVPIKDLSIGSYNVTVTYIGDDNYFNSTGNATFNVTKRTLNINITTKPVTVVGHEVVFNVTTSVNITEVITIKLSNNNTYTTYVKNGTGTFTVYGLEEGNYTAYVNFPGNSQYDVADNSTKFNISGKSPSAVTINVTDITVGENVTIKVNVTPGATGRVSLSIDGQVINAELKNGNATFVVPNLSARDFPFTVYYRGDDNYLISNASSHVVVRKKTTPIDVNVTNSTVGSVEYINVTVPTNATGHILININGTHYYDDIENGIAKFNITGLAVGNHTAYIRYVGDDNYLENSTEVNLTISKRTLTINITSASIIVVGHPVEFTITTSANITEVVTIRIGENNYTTFVENGIGYYTVYDHLVVGNYTAFVYFPGNTQYAEEQNSTKFNITGKSPVSLTIEVKNIALGEDAKIYVNVTGAQTGNVTLYIAGNPQTKEVIGGKVNFTVSGLSARDYYITAVYLENDDYLSNSTTANFTVYRKESQITINVTNIYVGQNETITVNVTANATGVVLINIAGVHVYAELDENGTAVVIFDDLGLGEYNVTATYLGDSNYLNSTTNASFNVTKLKTDIIINGTNITVGQTEILNITTSANFTEVVYVEINGINYTSFVKDGKGTFTVPFNLPVGTHTIYVYFPGNSQYDSERNLTVIKVDPKKVSNVTVKVDSITVGENATIYVNVTDGATGYVAVSIAGNTYNLLLNNSKANITLSDLTARHYHVSAYYLGDEYYLISNSTAEFDVNKKLTNINVTAINITYGRDAVISINITNGTTGVVLIDINGTDYYADINNGVAQLVIKNMAVGNYTVNVKYNGDANYNESANSTKFKVTKVNSEITIRVDGVSDIPFGSDVLIKVTGPADLTGVAVVYVVQDGLVDSHTVYINNGEGSLIVSKPAVGNYTAYAVYQENYKYLSNTSGNATFNVYANGTELSVNTHNIHVGDNETITVTIAGEYSGNVNITIDGIILRNASLSYNPTTNSSVATLIYSGNLDAGIHQVEAAYLEVSGDKIVTHKGSSIFIVSKINSTVTIIKPILDIKVGQNVTINVTINHADAQGTIDVYVNGVKHTLTMDNLTLVLPDLAAGHYMVQAMYSGDNKYLASSDDAAFDVYKNEVVVDLDVESIYVGDTEYLNVTLKDVNGVVLTDAVGYVLININGTHYYAVVDQGVAKVNINDLGLGNYIANATYIGDDKYYSNSTSDKFNVTKRETTIVITSTNIIVGQDEVFNITTSANLTVVVVIEVNGVNHTAFIEEGKGNFTLSGLTVGPYNATVYFNGNTKYDAVNNKTNFTVSLKHATSLNVTVEDITVGENITVYVNATKGINGPVYVTIGGVAYTYDLVDGKVNFTVPGLTARDYVVSAFFMGNEEYELCNGTSNFTVHKKNTSIDIKVVNITVDQSEIINVTVNENATGNVLITIGSIHVYAELDGGKASVNITGLAIGTHNVTVTYVGDENFTGNATNASFTVSKLSTTIIIKTDSIIYVGQDAVFNITTSANFTEVVTIELGGNTYHTFVENGTGTFTVSNLAVGPYTATVKFPGNTHYNATENSTTFEVLAKKPSEVTINVSDITVDEILVVRVNVTDGASGNVTIIIAGDIYTQKLDGNVAEFHIENLSARDYHITAMYLGDDYYLPSNATDAFTVNKKNVTLTVSVTNSTVGNVEYINVTLSNDTAKGNVLLTVDGAHYYGVIENGVARFNVTGLKEGVYDVNITYLGDEKFHPENATAKVNITRLTTTISIIGENIFVGQDEVFNITTSANFTEVVTVEIVGLDQYVAYVIDGNGTFTVPVKLSAGTYEVNVYFPGNTQYKPAQGSTTFTVTAQKASAVTVNVTDIVVGDNATIKVNVTKGATGNVTIVIAGDEYSKQVDENGVAEFNISGLIARDYHVTAIYEGDIEYEASRGAANFTVHKIASSVDLNVTDIVVGDTEVINVTVIDGATGVVLINISGTCYYSELTEGKATFNVAGLSAGKHVAVVTYLGNDKYENSSASKVFTVQPEIILEVGENNGTTTPITVKVSDNATGKVNVTVGNKTYEADVVNGTATVNVVNATPGKQNVTVTFDDGSGNPTVQNKTVDIPKVKDYEFSANATVVDKGNGTATVSVKVPEDATGNVTITVGNQTVTAPIKDGVATANITNIPVGSHDIDVSYGGDDKYDAISNRTHVNMPINLPTVNVVDHLTRGWNSQFDYEAVFTNEFGEVLVDTNVTFIVNGQTYTAKTESHGIARLSEKLPVGEYTVTSINPVTGEQVTKKLSIVARLIYNKDLTMDFIDGSHWDVLVIGDDGNPVGEGEIIDIYVNTIHYVSKTDANGWAKLKINLNPKSYSITAEYRAYKVANKLVVKQTMKLVKKTVTAKKGKKFTIKVKLKWSNGKAIKGKKIVVKFQGKKYSAKTNSKGIAKVTIKKSATKKLKKGKKYTYSATYNKTNTLKGKVKIK